MATKVHAAGSGLSPSSKAVKRYSDAGELHETQRKEHADKANVALTLMIITTLVGTFFDYQIYKPISDRIIYTNSDIANMVICLFLSAAPIIGAWILAHLVARIRIKQTRKTWHIIAAIVVFLLTAGLLAFTCWLRLTEVSPGAEDQLVYAWALNFLAILIAAISFVIHLFLTIKYDRHIPIAEKNRIQRDILETAGEAKQYTKVSSKDRAREEADYESYCNAFVELVDRALSLMDAARVVAANLYATTPEQYRQILSFPYRFGTKVHSDRASAKSTLLQICEAPQRGAQYHPYGNVDQNALLDDEALLVTENLDRRYRAIVNG